MTTWASGCPAPVARMCNDGVVRRLQPDVEMVLDQMAAMNLPTMESMPVDDARAFYDSDVSECVRRDRMSARSSTAPCPAPQATWRTGCTGRRPRARTRSSCTSTAAAGFSATPSRTIRCAGTCACGATRSSSRRTTATRPSTGSPPRSTTPWPRCGGSPTTPRHSAAYRAGSRCAAGARAATSRRWSAGSRETRADRHIVGQALLTPLTDGDLTRASYTENADGYGLTTALVRWLLRPLRRHRLIDAIPASHRCGPTICPGCRPRSWSRPSSIPCATRATRTPPHSRRRACRQSMSVPAATPTSR